MFSDDKKTTGFTQAFENLRVLDPKYGRPFRSNGVQTKPNTVEFRTAQMVKPSEQLADGRRSPSKWRVLRIEIKNYFEAARETLESLNEEAGEELVEIDSNATPQDDDYEIVTHEVTVAGDYGEQTNDLTYLEAMAAVAKLEYMALREHGDYKFADPNEDEETRLLKFVEVALLDKDFAATQFDAYEHFVDVSLDEGIMWTKTMTPHVSNKGRLVQAGQYKMSQVVAGANGRANALQNRKGGELTAAFDMYRRRDNVDNFLSAVTAVNEMNQLMEMVASVGQVYKEFYENPLDQSAYDNVLYEAQHCYDQAESVGNSAGIIVREQQSLMMLVKLNVYFRSLYACQAAIAEDMSKADAYADHMHMMQRNLRETENAMNLSFANQGEVAERYEGLDLTPQDIEARIEDYNENVLKKFQALIKDDLEGASEKRSNLGQSNRAPKP